jgi:hypothetical protein
MKKFITINSNFTEEVFTYNPFSYKIKDGNEIIITSCKDYEGALIIPSNIDNKTVTSIGEGAFACCDSLSSITIPNSVTSIGNCAFLGCVSLSSIKISEDNKNFTIIDNILYEKKAKALHTCFSKKSNIIIPNGILKINDHAFAFCKSLSNITIPDSVTSIGEDAFLGCKSLVIQCNSGSYTEKYCKNNNLEFFTTPNWLMTD